MQKIKKKIIIRKKGTQLPLTSINFLYNHFLKNDYLNQKHFKYPQLYENIFLFRNKKFNIFEFNKIETLSFSIKQKVSKTNKKMASCKYFVKTDRLFLNFKLNFFLIQNFNKILLKRIFLKKNSFSYSIGRIIKQTRRYTEIVLSVFGVMFIIRTRNLHTTIDKLMRNKFVYFHFVKKKKKDNKKVKINKFFKLEQGRRLLSKYQFKLLRFKIISLKKNIAVFSRREYLRLMKENNKKIKLNLFKKKKIYIYMLKQYFLYLKQKNNLKTIL